MCPNFDLLEIPINIAKKYLENEGYNIIGGASDYDKPAYLIAKNEYGTIFFIEIHASMDKFNDPRPCKEDCINYEQLAIEYFAKYDQNFSGKVWFDRMDMVILGENRAIIRYSSNQHFSLDVIGEQFD